MADWMLQIISHAKITKISIRINKIRYWIYSQPSR